jgi:hypothetical protein
MNEVIDLKFKGTCELGPWHGQWVEAENPFIPTPRGFYGFSAGKSAWVWNPSEPSVYEDMA